jgi:hypothetical protein
VLYYSVGKGGSPMFDLFTNPPQTDDFHWLVALFAGAGATEVIKRANDIPLKTFYPFKFNGKNEPIPMWKNYLFIQFVDDITIQICRSTNKFLKFIDAFDPETEVRKPVLVRKNAINESLELFHQGKFNDRVYLRRFYGYGSIVRVIEGPLIDKKVRLNMNIEPNMPGTKKILIDINGCRGSIELWKLAL